MDIVLADGWPTGGTDKGPLGGVGGVLYSVEHCPSLLAQGAFFLTKTMFHSLGTSFRDVLSRIDVNSISEKLAPFSIDAS